MTVIKRRPGHEHIKASASWVMDKPKEAPRAKAKKTTSRGPSEDTPDNDANKVHTHTQCTKECVSPSVGHVRDVVESE